MAEETAVLETQDATAAAPQVNAEENAAAGKAGENADPQANANAGEIKPKPLGGYQKKILKLEQEKETLLEALRRSGGEPKPVVAKPAVEVEDPEPKKDDFATLEEFYDARIAYLQKQTDKLVDKKLAEREQKQSAQSEEQKREAAYKEKAQAFAAENPDFGEVLDASEVRLSGAMKAAIDESDMAPALVYYLAKNEEEAERIFNMTPIKAAVAMGKIEASLAKEPTPAADGENSTRLPIPKAPPPSNPLRKTSSTSGKVDPLSAAAPQVEFEKEMNKRQFGK